MAAQIIEKMSGRNTDSNPDLVHSWLWRFVMKILCTTFIFLDHSQSLLVYIFNNVCSFKCCVCSLFLAFSNDTLNYFSVFGIFHSRSVFGIFHSSLLSVESIYSNNFYSFFPANECSLMIYG